MRALPTGSVQIFEVSEASRFALKAIAASRFAFVAFMGFLLQSLLPAWADPAPGASKLPASVVPSGSAYLTVKHLGESEQQASTRESELLSHRRATDPFGNDIRGPFKGLPPVVEHPTPPQQAMASQVVDAVNGPTLEKAVQELTIGAVNVGTHEILIGSRPIHEGDLLVLESGGHQFVVWVQSVGVRGVLFCDIDVQKQVLKPFGSGPKELSAHSDSGISDVRSFFGKDAQP
jgi:hypothetical protein